MQLQTFLYCKRRGKSWQFMIYVGLSMIIGDGLFRYVFWSEALYGKVDDQTKLSDNNHVNEKWNINKHNVLKHKDDLRAIAIPAEYLPELVCITAPKQKECDFWDTFMLSCKYTLQASY